MAQLKSGTRIYGDATVDGRLDLGTNNNIRIGDVSTGSSIGIGTGTHNFFAGASAGAATTSGSNNVFFGRCAGQCNTTGFNNFFAGFNAGCNVTTGACNNFLGNSAGQGTLNSLATVTTVTSGTGTINTTFNNVSATGGSGSGALFTVVRDAGGLVSTITITNPGANYTVGNTLTILGTLVGGSTPTNDITITVRSLGVVGGCNNFFGSNAGRCNNNGSNNNFFGFSAGCLNTTGSYNNFFGFSAGRSNTTASNNNFFGLYSGFLNTTGCHNSFFGVSSGRSNTTGKYNNYFGFLAGFNNNGSQNNFIGVGAGRSTTSATNNNFFGLYAGKGFGAPITGGDNNFFGNCAGFNFTSGSCNNFLGCQTGFNNSTGNHNNFLGWRAGLFNTTGSNNNFFGQSAGCTQTLGDRNVAIGYSVQLPITTGSDQLVIGSGSTAWITGNVTGISSYNVGIGTTNPSQTLHVQGNARVTGFIIDSTGVTGSAGQVLQSSATGTLWANAAVSGGSGDGADFNSGITTSTYVSVGPSLTGFTGIGISFPSTASRRYLVESIHVANVSPSDLYLTSRIDYITGTNVPLTNKIIVPYQGSLEVLDESIVANPSDMIRFAAFTGIGATAAGVVGGLDCFITYTTKNATNYIGSGSNSTTTSDATVFTSTSFPSVINTIILTNSSDNADVDASVSIVRGGTVRQGYLVYNLTIPQNSSVQILPKAKKLNVNDTISVRASVANILSTHVSGIFVV
jgi:hypothetical protein